MPDLTAKSSVDTIRARFDADVERFSNLQTGQSATVDAPLVLELIAEAAAAVTPGARRMLDVGCGAGNYVLKLLEHLPDLDVDLIDLSRPMLDRAVARIAAVTRGTVQAHQGDVRDLALPAEAFDVVTAAAVLHHLREEAEWRRVFQKLYDALRPGGGLWISDLVVHDLSALQALMWRRYGDYLTGLQDEAYRDHVFAYIEQEDSPRSLGFQLDLLRAVGFRHVEVLHKNSVMAAFGGVK